MKAELCVQLSLGQGIEEKLALIEVDSRPCVSESNSSHSYSNADRMIQQLSAELTMHINRSYSSWMQLNWEVSEIAGYPYIQKAKVGGISEANST